MAKLRPCCTDRSLGGEDWTVYQGPVPTLGSHLSSPYLDRPLIPLAVALPPLLENIEAELANKKLELTKKRRLRRRAELIRGLLMPSRIT